MADGIPKPLEAFESWLPHRVAQPVEEFRRIHPKPPGCKGCEVDYIAPLSNADRRRGIISWREAADRKERGRPCIEHGSPFSAS